MVRKKLIDISEGQDVEDYSKIDADAVIMRCGFTAGGSMTVRKDKRFEDHYSGLKNKGIPLGVYFYSNADTEEHAIKEAEFAIECVKDKNISFPIFFDTESNEKQRPLSTSDLTKVAKAFCKTIEAAGYEAGIYASANGLKTELDMSELPYTVWVAHYGVDSPAGDNGTIWQYSSSGTVPGIKGNVDMNYWLCEGLEPSKEQKVIEGLQEKINALKQRIDNLYKILFKE